MWVGAAKRDGRPRCMPEGARVECRCVRASAPRSGGPGVARRTAHSEECDDGMPPESTIARRSHTPFL